MEQDIFTSTEKCTSLFPTRPARIKQKSLSELCDWQFCMRYRCFSEMNVDYFSSPLVLNCDRILILSLSNYITECTVKEQSRYQKNNIEICFNQHLHQLKRSSLTFDVQSGQQASNTRNRCTDLWENHHVWVNVIKYDAKHFFIFTLLQILEGIKKESCRKIKIEVNSGKKIILHISTVCYYTIKWTRTVRSWILFNFDYFHNNLKRHTFLQKSVNMSIMGGDKHLPISLAYTLTHFLCALHILIIN